MGAPLQFYIYDETGAFKQSIQREILVRDRVMYCSGLGIAPERMPLDEFQQFLTDGDGVHSITMTPGLSIHRFQEIQEPNLSLETLNEWLSTGQLAGYFLISADFVTSNIGSEFIRPANLNRTRMEKLAALKVWFEEIASTVRRAVVIDQTNLEQKLEDVRTKPIETAVQQVFIAELSSRQSGLDAGGQIAEIPLANWPKMLVVPFVFAFLMVMNSGTSLVVTSTIEEKSSKVAALLIASATPVQILDGKLLGNLLTMLIGVTVFVVLIAPPGIGLLGILVGYESDLFEALMDPSKLFTWCLFLLLGFAFGGYINGALGSWCTNAKETMMVLYPVQFIYTFGVLPAVIYAMVVPHSTLTQVLSFVPFLSAPVMVSRSAELPDWPVYSAVVLVLCSSILMMRNISARIFAHGMSSETTPSGLLPIFRKMRYTT